MRVLGQTTQNEVETDGNEPKTNSAKDWTKRCDLGYNGPVKVINPIDSHVVADQEVDEKVKSTDYGIYPPIAFNYDHVSNKDGREGNK
jgi:hypothetical protein